MQRTLAKAHEKDNEDQIQNHPESAIYAVLGDTARACMVTHRNLRDTRTGITRQ
jgi:hypothetical protein